MARGRRLAGSEYGVTFGTAQTATGVPARGGVVAEVFAAARTADAVVAESNVVEGAWIGIERRIHKSEWFPDRLVDADDQPGPERGDGAGSADHTVLAVHADLVAGTW